MTHPSSPVTQARTEAGPRPGLTGAASPAKAWLRALETSARLCARADATAAAMVDDLGERFGPSPALLSDREQFSFAEMAAQTRRYTRWARAQGLKRGDVVALLSPNRPDYFNAWVGISRTGAAVALLNTNLTDRALAHCIATAGPAHLICAPELMAAYGAGAVYLQHQPKLWSHGPAVIETDGATPLDLAPFSGAPLTLDELDWAERDGAGLHDRALYIYTSGTTGLPKAANVSHRRVLTWCGWFSGLMDAGPHDRLYNCLPMYHSVGGVVGVGGALVNGGSVVVRERFSASQFWSDVVRWDCTLVQYIGELCRYLLAAPPHPDENRHKLRLACGNGLRADVWNAFQARFGVERILEFYAATEGTFSLFNVEGRPGAIGRIPSFLAHRFPAAIVRFDPRTDLPARDEAGRCLRCGPGEAGEAIGLIANDAEAKGGRFEGYSNAEETSRKVLRDVFAPGDAWFRTGDLMRKDEAGFFYFVDRVGDNFRWRGENVSTSEVADVLASCVGVQGVAVYGVEVPGCEGRAGMAALTTTPVFELADLRRELAARLPVYARPVFLRLVATLDTTETFKLKTQALKQEGYDPSAIADALFFDAPGAGAYVALDAAANAFIEAGRGGF
jgi:fatty-acyl-CoA synthase